MSASKRLNSSSGRWDASGNFYDAVLRQETAACEWARGLSTDELCSALEAMVDTDAFTLYERKYVLLFASGRLRTGEL